MINLIPPYAKKTLKREYWIRVLTVWLMICSTALVIGTFLLWPTYSLVDRMMMVSIDSGEETVVRDDDRSAVTKMLQQSTQQAQMILAQQDQVPLSAYIKLFRSLEGSGVTLSSVSLKRTTEGLVESVGISGDAVDRQSLAAFRDRLLEETVVTNVDLPISNLVLDKDIPFSITVTITESDI